MIQISFCMNEQISLSEIQLLIEKSFEYESMQVDKAYIFLVTEGSTIRIKVDANKKTNVPTPCFLIKDMSLIGNIDISIQAAFYNAVTDGFEESFRLFALLMKQFSGDCLAFSDCHDDIFARKNGHLVFSDNDTVKHDFGRHKHLLS